MLANKLTSRTPMIAKVCAYHTPAASVAIARVFSSCRNGAAATSNYRAFTKEQTHIPTEYASRIHASSLIAQPSSIHRKFATQPIICSHEDAFAKDLSIEQFDAAYKFLYEQHKHPHGPWVKVLQSAQTILNGQKAPRILVVASGPGEPAATLAANFPNAEIVSAHSTAKCMEWSRERMHELGLFNVTPKLVSGMEQLDTFTDGSFDLVVSGYGLANSIEPQIVLNEVHRVLKLGGSFISYVWEQLPADPGSDIILRHACVGPNPWHKTVDNVDAVEGFRCPVRTKKPMSLSKPHLRELKCSLHYTTTTYTCLSNKNSIPFYLSVESTIEKAKLSLVQVTRDEYPLQLGSTKEKAFKTLTLPIHSELQELKAANHYHPSDAAEAFEDVLNEGFMVKQHSNGEIEVPYNVYKYIVARRPHEDSDGYLDKGTVERRNGKKVFKFDDIPK